VHCLMPPQRPAFPVSYELVSIGIQGAQFRQDTRRGACYDAVASPVELKNSMQYIHLIYAPLTIRCASTYRLTQSSTAEMPSRRLNVGSSVSPFLRHPSVTVSESCHVDPFALDTS
jgi:hypothetical protein